MTQTVSPSSPLIDSDTQSDLIDDLGAQIFETMVRSLARGLTGRLSEIEQAISVGDPDGLIRAAHDIRGSALNLGFIAIGLAASELEQSAAHGHIRDLSCQHLRHAIELSRAEIPDLRIP